MAPPRPLLSCVASHLAFVYCLIVGMWHIYVFSRDVGGCSGSLGLGAGSTCGAREHLFLHNIPSWLLLVLFFLSCLTLRLCIVCVWHMNIYSFWRGPCYLGLPGGALQFVRVPCASFCLPNMP